MQDYTLTFDIQQSWRDDRLVLGREVLGKDKHGNDMTNITLDGRTINQIWVSLQNVVKLFILFNKK